MAKDKVDIREKNRAHYVYVNDVLRGIALRQGTRWYWSPTGRNPNDQMISADSPRKLKGRITEYLKGVSNEQKTIQQ